MPPGEPEEAAGDLAKFWPMDGDRCRRDPVWLHRAGVEEPRMTDADKERWSGSFTKGRPRLTGRLRRFSCRRRGERRLAQFTRVNLNWRIWSAGTVAGLTSRTSSFGPSGLDDTARSRCAPRSTESNQSVDVDPTMPATPASSAPSRTSAVARACVRDARQFASCAFGRLLWVGSRGSRVPVARLK